MMRMQRRIYRILEAMLWMRECVKTKEGLRLFIGYQHAEELASIYICYSTGDWFNTPLSSFIAPIHVCSVVSSVVS